MHLKKNGIVDKVLYMESNYKRYILYVADSLLSLSVLFGSLSVYAKSSYSTVINLFLVVAVLFGIGVCCFINWSKIKSRAICLFALFAAGVGFFPVAFLMLIYNGGGSKKMFLLTLITPLYVVYLLVRSDSKQFIKNLIYTYFTIIVFDLIMWSLFSFNYIGTSSTLPVVWGDYNAFGITPFFWVTQLSDFLLPTGSYAWRFTSIFVEGPVFSSITIIILALALYYVNVKWWIVLSIVIGGFLSFSTTAYIGISLLFIPIIYIYLKKLPKNRLFSYLRFFFWLIFLVLILFIILFIYRVFSSKILTDSGQTHLADLSSGLMAFLDSPIIGHGLDNFDGAWLKFASSYRSTASQTTSLFSLLAQGGIIIIIPYLFPLYLFINNSSRKEIYVVIAILFALLVSPIEDAALVYIILALGYLSVSEKNFGRTSYDLR